MRRQHGAPGERRIEGRISGGASRFGAGRRVDDAIDRRSDLRERTLCRHPRLGVGRWDAPPDQALALDVRVAHDEPRFVAQGDETGLDELDRLDDDRARATAARVGDGREDSWPDRGVDDRLEIAERRGVSEDKPAQGRAIEASVRASICLAEPGDHGRERRLAWFDDFAGDLVGVDDHDAGTLAEPTCDGRLAAADRAGQAEDERRVGRRRGGIPGFGHPASLGAAQLQLLPDQDEPLHELPDQLLPDHELPDQVLPDHELLDQDEPLQLLPDHELPDQDEPLQLLPDHELPDQDDPFHVPPDQL